jgi:hypothetical protein
MTDTQHTIQDLISTAYEQKPVEFQDTFNDLMLDRLAAAVDTKKLEVATTMFGDQAGSEDYADVNVEVDAVET